MAGDGDNPTRGPRGGFRRCGSEDGFTLVELLVVIVIIGLLAAVAIPSFFAQRDKAHDAGAKSAVRNAQQAIEVYATDHNGRYGGATPAQLIDIEATLTGVGLGVTAAPDSYTVTVPAAVTGNSFSIERHPSGDVDFSCTVAGQAGCPASGNWAG